MDRKNLLYTLNYKISLFLFKNIWNETHNIQYNFIYYDRNYKEISLEKLKGFDPLVIAYQEDITNLTVSVVLDVLYSEISYSEEKEIKHPISTHGILEERLNNLEFEYDKPTEIREIMSKGLSELDQYFAQMIHKNCHDNNDDYETNSLYATMILTDILRIMGFDKTVKEYETIKGE